MNTNQKYSSQKHIRYGKAYGKNELYWGLGVECESYLQFSQTKRVSADFFLNHHKPERYSVNYFTSYKKEAFQKAISKFKGIEQPISLPILLNAHSLTKCDSNFEHKTLYKKGTPENPKFEGRTIFELCQSENPKYFKEKYEVDFVFDGDSIEIMTQNFYKTTLDKVLKEFSALRKEFIQNLHDVFTKYRILDGEIQVDWMKQNHGFAVMITNPENLAIFNNGTYHINITLPTMLNEQGKIKNWLLFEEQHKHYIRLIQWMEPILIAVFGSADPLTCMEPTLFTQASQRGALSRYIGIGTYDTDRMKPGKYMSIDLSETKSSWYTEYHEHSGYQPLQTIGLDINFNKHWNHGIEIRFFDWFPENRLQGLLKCIIHLGDVSLTKSTIQNPVDHPIWKSLLIRCLEKGNDAGITRQEAYVFSEILGEKVSESKKVADFFAEVHSKLSTRWKTHGPCSKYFLQKTFLTKKDVLPPPLPICPPPEKRKRSVCVIV